MRSAANRALQPSRYSRYELLMAAIVSWGNIMSKLTLTVASAFSGRGAEARIR